MSNIHERRRDSNGTRSLTHSILINLFIKVGLNSSSPASPAKYCFCRRVLNGLYYSLGKVLWRGGGGGGGGTRMAYIFESLGTSLPNTLRNEVGHFRLMRFSFVKMLFFAYRLLLTRR